MFGHRRQPVRQAEDLPLLHRDRRRRIERRLAPLATANFLRNHEIGLGDLAQRVAPVTLLPAARLARTAAQSPGGGLLLLQSVARRRLGTVRTVQSYLPANRPHFPLQLGNSLFPLRDHAVLHRYRVVLRSNQLLDFGRKAHPSLDSDSSLPVFPDFCRSAFSTRLWLFGLTSAWELRLSTSNSLNH